MGGIFMEKCVFCHFVQFKDDFNVLEVFVMFISHFTTSNLILLKFYIYVHTQVKDQNC